MKYLLAFALLAAPLSARAQFGGNPLVAFNPRVDPLTEEEIHEAFQCWWPSQGAISDEENMEYIENYGKDAATVRAVVIARATRGGA